MESDVSKLLMRGWRTDLLPEEKDLILPNVVGKLEALEESFERLIVELHKARNDPYFDGLLRQLAMDPQFTSQKYCDEIEHNVRENFLNSIADAKGRQHCIKEVRDFSAYLWAVDGIFQSVNQNKGQLFWMSIKTVLTIADPASGQAVDRPGEYAILLTPFRIMLAPLCANNRETITGSKFSVELKGTEHRKREARQHNRSTSYVSWQYAT